MRTQCILPAALLALLAGLTAGTARADEKPDIHALIEKAMKDAAAKVAPSVVQIETVGGAETVSAGPNGTILKGVGPTTGLVVSADGYIISSAFNFANKPTDIFVSVPGQKRAVAKVVGTDKTRMLSLLKVDLAGLSVPEAAPRKDLTVGQWALALGRTLDTADRPPSMSAGIISALGRVWGKAVQTDAKVSPVNYGGPLIDIQGRVIGVLVPASPNAEGETAGVEWYDSGIGFAIPLEEINAVLPRLKEGKELRRGLLGITPQNPDIYNAVPTVGNVAPDSAAAGIGLKSGDVFLEVDGKPVRNHAQLQHALGPKYEGDTVTIKIRRGMEEKTFEKVVLSGAVTAFQHSFLGVLPVRDDPELGVEVRYVYPKSPAEAAGIKVGDRLMKIGLAAAAPGGPPPQMQAFSGRDQLLTILEKLPVGADVKVELKRGDKTETVTAKLARQPDEVPDELPKPETASAKKALAPRKPVAGPGPGPGPMPPFPPKGDDPFPPNDDKPIPPKADASFGFEADEKKADDKKPDEKSDKKEEKKSETGKLSRKNALGREYWAFVPENYDPNVSHAVVLWLHPAGRGGKDADDVIDAWERDCERSHIILVGPVAAAESWQASDAEFVRQALQEVMGQYTVDKKRVVAHGMGVGGQMAFFLGFQDREQIRGVATVGAVLTTQPKDNVGNQRLSFFVVAGGKDPLLKQIQQVKPTLAEKRFPVTYVELPGLGREYLDFKTLDLLVRWIDSLDKL